MPSLTYGLGLGEPLTRSKLVSFSVKSHVAPSARTRRSPSSECEARTAVPPSISRNEGRSAASSQDHTLRNQMVGRTCSVAGSGPRLQTVISTRMSSGAALAYSRSEEHTSELQSQSNLVCRLLLEKKKPHLVAVLTQHSSTSTF